PCWHLFIGFLSKVSSMDESFVFLSKVSSMDEKFDSLRRYNFWDGHVPQLGFLRKNYTNNIFNYINNTLIKVLVGQRRAGKSYILRQVTHRLITSGIDPKNIFYINKEFIDFDFVNTYRDLDSLIKLYRENLNPQGKIYLFIDEIQNIIEWERFANSYAQDFTDSYELFISGSNSRMLSGELATLLS